MCSKNIFLLYSFHSGFRTDFILKCVKRRTDFISPSCGIQAVLNVMNDNIMIVAGPANCKMEIHKEIMNKLLYLLLEVSEICDFGCESLI